MHLSQGTRIGNIKGPGNLANLRTDPGGAQVDALLIFMHTLSNIIGFLTIIAGLWFIAQLFLGALNWITSGSDKDALQKSQRKITNATIGLVVTIMSYSLAALAGLILGFDILDPVQSLLKLKP